MTDDIIPRLRFRADYADYPSDAEAFNDAADEIERLRAELAAAKTRADAAEDWMAAQMSAYTSIEAERDALRAQLAETRKELRQIEADCEADYPPSPGALKYAIRDVLKMIKGGGDE